MISTRRGRFSTLALPLLLIHSIPWYQTIEMCCKFRNKQTLKTHFKLCSSDAKRSTDTVRQCIFYAQATSRWPLVKRMQEQIAPKIKHRIKALILFSKQIPPRSIQKTLLSILSSRQVEAVRKKEARIRYCIP